MEIPQCPVILGLKHAVVKLYVGSGIKSTIGVDTACASWVLVQYKGVQFNRSSTCVLALHYGTNAAMFATTCCAMPIFSTYGKNSRSPNHTKQLGMDAAAGTEAPLALSHALPAVSRMLSGPCRLRNLSLYQDIAFPFEPLETGRSDRS